MKITELDRSTVFMDASGSGLQHRTAWAGAGDGVLFYDADGSGTINDDREYVFTEWDKTAGDDLTALRSRFDTNGDGRLSGAELNGFKVMVSNADGSRTAQTAAPLGITEIRLTQDTTRLQRADGSVITGQATFLMNSATKVLANVMRDQGYACQATKPSSVSSTVTSASCCAAPRISPVWPPILDRAIIAQPVATPPTVRVSARAQGPTQISAAPSPIPQASANVWRGGRPMDRLSPPIRAGGRACISPTTGSRDNTAARMTAGQSQPSPIRLANAAHRSPTDRTKASTP